MESIEELKPLIRSTLLSLGRRATDREFKREFKEILGESIDDVLSGFGNTFWQYMKTIPDVCRIWAVGSAVFIERVSTEETRHMDHLTIAKKPAKVKSRNIQAGNFQIVQSQAYTIRRPSNRFLPSHGPYRQQHNPMPAKKPQHKSMPQLPKMITTTYNKTQPVRQHNVILPSQMKTVVYKPAETNENANPVAALDENEPAWTIRQRQPMFGSAFFSFQNPFECSLRELSTKTIGNLKTEVIKQETGAQEKDTSDEKPTTRSPPKSFFACALSNIKQQNNLNDNAGHLEGYVTTSFSVPHPNSKLAISKEFKTLIREYHSPSQFVFQFDLDVLQSLMEEMSFHYNDSNNGERLMIKNPHKGLTVAAFDDGRWFRGEIIVISAKHALVHLVDFGCSKYVDIHHVRYLEESFSQLHRMAAKGRIFGINPKDGKQLWSPTEMIAFLDKIADVELRASIRGRREGVYELEVSNNKLKLSDFMIDAGLADPTSS